MPKFSSRSKRNLRTCVPDLQVIFNEVVKAYDCTIIVGHRGLFEQNKAYQDRTSRLQWPESKHNRDPSWAVDVAPYPIIWNDTNRFYHFAGYVFGIADQMQINLRWGGDWDMDRDLSDQTLMDLVHFDVWPPAGAFLRPGVCTWR